MTGSFQVRLPKDTNEALKRLARKRGISQADIIRAAIRLLNHVDDAQAKGGHLFVENGGEREKLLILY